MQVKLLGPFIRNLTTVSQQFHPNLSVSSLLCERLSTILELIKDARDLFFLFFFLLYGLFIFFIFLYLLIVDSQQTNSFAI